MWLYKWPAKVLYKFLGWLWSTAPLYYTIHLRCMLRKPNQVYFLNSLFHVAEMNTIVILCGVLKFNSFFNFAEVQGTEECAEHLRRITASSVVPPQYWLTLQCLLRHLARVCQASAANLLNARALAEIFSPALFRQLATRYTHTHTPL